MPLGEADRAAISRHVAEAEGRTGAQIVAAVVDRSDSYPELPWKAFALGASAGSLSALWIVASCSESSTVRAALFVAMMALGAGAGLALAAVFLRPVSRALLDGHRAEAEVRQHAEGLFLRQQLFRTERRVGVLLLASRFERRVVVLADVGIAAQTTPEELQAVVAAMTPALAADRIPDAFAAGLSALERLLADRGLVRSGGNEIPDAVVEERR